MKKIIHCFFDTPEVWKKNSSSTFRMCYNSWLEFCPDYEIKIWHDKMPEFVDMLRQSRFLLECYKRKMWAFVSDYVRIYALYNYGGIYLDTDIQLVKNLDSFLVEPFFVSIENDILNGKNIVEPALMGGERGHSVFKHTLEFYNSEKIFSLDYFISPMVLSQMLFQISGFDKIPYNNVDETLIDKYYANKSKVVRMDNFELYLNQAIYNDDINKIKIFPSQYFCPNWQYFERNAFTQNTYAIHWNQSSWFKFLRNNACNQIKSYRYKNSFMRNLFLIKQLFNKNRELI